MVTHWRTIVLMAVVATTVAASTFLLAQSRQVSPVTRQLHRSLDRSLKVDVHPGDGEVVVIDDVDPGLEVDPPSGTAQVAWKMRIGTVPLITSVDSMAPQLTKEEDWIQTNVAARDEEVLGDSPKWLMQLGDRIEFKEQGSEMQMNGVRVTVPGAWAVLF